MNCKEFEHEISDFIHDNLSFTKLKKFIEHLNDCESCREELTIQFLIEEGLSRLETGNAFDLQTELYDKIENSKRKIQFHLLCLKVGMVFEILAIVGILGIILWIIF